MAESAAARIFKGPLNNHHYKQNDLIALADALGMPYEAKITVSNLITSIKKFLLQHPDLAQKPQFQGLVSYRSRATGAAKRTSADKAKEVEIEAERDIAPTGANKTLVEMGIKADPPAQHQHLSTAPSSAEDPVDVEPTNNDTVDDSSPEGTGSLDLPDLPDMNEHTDWDFTSLPGVADLYSLPTTPPRSVQNVANDAHDFDLVVKFFNQSDRQAPPEEVWIPKTEPVDIDTTTDMNGQRAYVTKLSKLMPVALDLNTPVKQNGTYLWRSGYTSTGAKIPIGTVESILSADGSRHLRSEKIDTFRLEPQADGSLACDVFYLPKTGEPVTSVSGPTAVVAAAATLLSTSTQPAQPDQPARTIPHSQSRPVLHTTPQQTQNSSTTEGSTQDFRNLSHAEKELFMSFLREVIHAPDREWNRSSTAGDIYDRYTALESAKDFLSKELRWGRSQGGFQVRKGEDIDDLDITPFIGITFTLLQVTDAMRITHSLASNDRALFGEKTWAVCPEVKRWLDEGVESAMDAKFRDMSIKAFKAHIAACKDESEAASRAATKAAREAARAEAERKARKRMGASRMAEPTRKRVRGRGDEYIVDTEDELDDA